MTKVTIDRELLERAALLLKDGTQPPEGCANFDDWTAQGNKVSDELRALLAAPHQPEGDAEKQLVEWARDRFNRYGRYKGQIYGNTDWALARAIHTDLLAYHQRAMAELLNECQRLENLLGDLPRANAELREEVEQLKEESFEGLYNAVIDERDTLRQQLAERDATIERLEAGITRLQEQSFKMRQQRDKLAGLLRHVRPSVALVFVRWARAAAHLPANTTVESGLLARIDAALAEVNK